MAETQASSLSGTIYASIIELAIIDYQWDEMVVTPFFRQTMLSGQSDTARFPRLVKSTGPTSGTPTNETTALSTTELTTTSATVQVGRVGIARELTETAKEDSVIGRALWIMGFVEDAAKLYGEYFDTQATTLFSSVANEVGATGNALTIPTMVAAVARQRAGKAKGPNVISLHDNQLKQLQQAQATAVATAWDRFYTPSGLGVAYGGVFMDAPIWASSLNPTSTGDRLGCIFVNGQAKPTACAFAFVVKRMPSSLTESHVLMDANVWASYARTGHGEIADNFATAIRSVNA